MLQHCRGFFFFEERDEDGKICGKRVFRRAFLGEEEKKLWRVRTQKKEGEAGKQGSEGWAEDHRRPSNPSLHGSV